MEEERIRYVYKVFDKLNEDKFYIGTTFDTKRRWKEHQKDSNSKKLKIDILEFGIQDFDMEVIFSGIEDEAYAEEVRLIAELKPYYNNPGDTGGKWNDDTKGENNSQSKLREQDIIDICIRVVVNGEQVVEVAKDYPQVKEAVIYGIVNGNTWKHVKEAPRRKVSNIGIPTLKKKDIVDICIRVVENGEKVSDVSKDYSEVKDITLYKIVNGETWKNIKEAPRRKISGGIGEEQGLSILKEKDIIDICIRVVENGEQVVNVSKDYPQVEKTALYRIINGETWKHVKEAPRKKAKKILTKDKVFEIRTLSEEGKTNLEIRTMYNKSKDCIRKCINGESFKNYPGPIKGVDY